MNTNNTNKDYSARVKSFNDYAEIVRREKIRIKQIELENQLLKELHQNKPSLDEAAKQVQEYITSSVLPILALISLRKRNCLNLEIIRKRKFYILKELKSC